MADVLPLNAPNRGRITEGPTTSLVERTLEFVFSELANWRDDPDRPTEDAEERLNAQLCKYLTRAASDRFPIDVFYYEEKQTGTRRVDISALSSGRDRSGALHTTRSTIPSSFLKESDCQRPVQIANGNM